MFDLPKKYEQSKKIPKNNVILKSFSLEVRQKLTDYIKKVELSYQIAGEEIASVINEDYNIQVVQFYNFEIKDIKNANFIANIFQQEIKALCVLRLYDNKEELYSFGLKRLNKNDKTQIVLEDNFLTEKFLNIPLDFEKDKFNDLLCYNNIKNKYDKKSFYEEMYIKAYFFKNIKVYKQIENIFNTNIWYQKQKLMEVYNIFKEIVKNREDLKSIILNSDAIKINENISNLILQLEQAIKEV